MAGLTNLGNTCFISSVLQGIAASPLVLKRLTSALPNLQTGTLPHAAADVLIRLGAKENAENVIHPAALVRLLREERRSLGFAQQDAEEAFLMIVGALFSENFEEEDNGLAEIAELSNASGPHSSIAIPVSISDPIFAQSIMTSASIDEEFAGEVGIFNAGDPNFCSHSTIPAYKEAHPFRGLLTSCLQCAKCGGHHEWKVDPFFDLSLTISGHSGAPNGVTATLEDCLQRWTEAEIVEGALCDSCLLHSALEVLRKRQKQVNHMMQHLPKAKRQEIEQSLIQDIALLSSAESAVLSEPSLPEHVRKRCLHATEGRQAGTVVKMLRIARAPQA